MANNENDFQIALKKEAIKQHANAMRIRHFSLGGIPDLYIKHPEFKSIWIECKFERKTPKKGVNIVTPLQHAWLIEERKAGGFAGWCLCVRVNRTQWDLYCGVHNKFDPIPHFLCSRKRGEDWSLRRIICHIINQQEGIA